MHPDRADELKLLFAEVDGEKGYILKPFEPTPITIEISELSESFKSELQENEVVFEQCVQEFQVKLNLLEYEARQLLKHLMGPKVPHHSLEELIEDDKLLSKQTRRRMACKGTSREEGNKRRPWENSKKRALRNQKGFRRK